MADRVADIFGVRTPHAKGTVWPARVDQYLDPGVDEEAVDRWAAVSRPEWSQHPPASRLPAQWMATATSNGSPASTSTRAPRRGGSARIWTGCGSSKSS